MSVYAVIMAGGSGKRFWPASRKARPKQLLSLAGDVSLLRQTVDRIVPLCGVDNVRIATGAHLAEATLELLPELSRSQLLIEPVPRNTAPCLAWAAATVARSDPQAVIMALPSDPHIGDEKRFRETLQLAIDKARSGVITTIGITPTHPETGYGYIEAKAGEGDVCDVARFVEKPDLETATRFVADGNFYWNAGMFFYRACDMVDAVQKHMPALADGIAKLDAAAADGREAEELARVFPTLPAVSIDHGVMEHVDQMAVVRGDFGWSDLGGWRAVGELATKDAAGNSAPTNAVLIDADDNHVVDMRTAGGKRVIALVGVSNLVVVQTDDALLVIDRDQAQRVKEIVAALDDDFL
jgi:mannose-1-phosphate guanylyltransferase